MTKSNFPPQELWQEKLLDFELTNAAVLRVVVESIGASVALATLHAGVTRALTGVLVTDTTWGDAALTREATVTTVHAVVPRLEHHMKFLGVDSKVHGTKNGFYEIRHFQSCQRAPNKEKSESTGQVLNYGLPFLELSLDHSQCIYHNVALSLRGGRHTTLLCCHTSHCPVYHSRKLKADSYSEVRMLSSSLFSRGVSSLQKWLVRHWRCTFVKAEWANGYIYLHTRES